MHSDLKNARARAWSKRRAPAYDAPLRVLIVDDNETGAESLATYLSIEAMDCRIALGGAQALELGMAWLPDLIIMDISMPEVNGLDATHALRHDRRTGNILIIAFTSLDEAEVSGHLTYAAFDGYCQKGQSPRVLLALINTFLDKH